MGFNKEKIIETMTFIGKLVSFISLVMTVIIKTRILLGLKNPSEEWRSKDKSDEATDTEESKDADKS